MSGENKAVGTVLSALPSLASTFIEAAIGALNDGRVHALKAELMAALETARLWETIGKANAQNAVALAHRCIEQEKTIEQLRADIARLQQEDKDA